MCREAHGDLPFEIDLKGLLAEMNKSVRSLAAALLFAGAAPATDWQRYEVYLGYDFVRFNPNPAFIPSFNANGGGGQFVYNFNRWIDAAVDPSGVTKGTRNGFPVDTSVASFTAGPRFTWNRGGRWVPYGPVLFGGTYRTTSTGIGVLPLAGAVVPPGIVLPPGVPFSKRIGASNTGFLTTGNTTNRNNFRYSGGVTFMFGGPIGTRSQNCAGHLVFVSQRRSLEFSPVV